MIQTLSSSTHHVLSITQIAARLPLVLAPVGDGELLGVVLSYF